MDVTSFLRHSECDTDSDGMGSLCSDSETDVSDDEDAVTAVAARHATRFRREPSPMRRRGPREQGPARTGMSDSEARNIAWRRKELRREEMLREERAALRSPRKRERDAPGHRCNGDQGAAPARGRAETQPPAGARIRAHTEGGSTAAGRGFRVNEVIRQTSHEARVVETSRRSAARELIRGPSGGSARHPVRTALRADVARRDGSVLGGRQAAELTAALGVLRGDCGAEEAVVWEADPDEKRRLARRSAAYAAALAVLASSGSPAPSGRNSSTAPVAAGSTVTSGFEVSDAAVASLDDALKMPTFSMARVVHEDPAFVRLAQLPRTNVARAEGPLPALKAPAGGDPAWRPKNLTEVYTENAVEEIMDWYGLMAEYEAAGRLRRGKGLRRPPDLVLDDQSVQPAARGRSWYLLDHIRSGGVLPILPIEESTVTPSVLEHDRIERLGTGYHDRSVIEQLVEGHRNLSECETVTVLSANHSGAMRYHEKVGEQFDHDAHDDRRWLMAVKPVEKPLMVTIRGRLRECPVFVPTCPCRVEPVNGVPQGPTKVRVTTDKSWPKREVEVRDLSANAWMDLESLGKVKFPRTTQFAAAAAIIGCAEPSADASPTARAAAAAAAPEDHCFMWKIDLFSAYRYWSNHRSELWMYGKQWAGESFLDTRSQFGDASMVAGFEKFTDFFIWLIRRLRDGDASLRAECRSFGEPLWDAIDARPTAESALRWLEDRGAGGLEGRDTVFSYEAGYIDDIFGVALGRRRASAMRDLAVGLAEYLGFAVAPKKIAGPLRTMTVLGAQVELDHRLLSLDPEKAASYGLAATEAAQRKTMRASEFLSLTCKLVHAAQYRPAGRTYLTSMFTALRRASKTGASRVRIGYGAMRDLRWWVRALALPNDGVAAFPRCHFPPSGSSELLEFAYDASGNEGMGGAMLRKDARGITTCFYFEHAWERNTRPKHLHINVKEGLAGFAALATFYPLAPWRCALAHGDNTTEQATSEANRARSVLQTVVLQHRAAFIADTGVVVRQRRVKSKDNVLADAVSRLASKDFKREARRLGATRFVRLGLAASARALIDDVIVTLERLELDGENTSGTARSDAEVVSREKRYEEMQRRSERSPPEAPRRRRRWGFMTGFCGIDSMSCAAARSGGEPVAGFDINELVRKLWTERTGLTCWADFYNVLAAAKGGHLDWLAPLVLMYISGSPCPDFSSAGHGHGTAGRTGGLWIGDCELGIRMRPPVIIREMVTGIFQVDDGSAFFEAVDAYESAGYITAWSVRKGSRHGDCTARLRVFLVAILPECLRENVGAEQFFSSERTAAAATVMVANCLDRFPEPGLVYDRLDHVQRAPERETVDGYDGPRLWGTIGKGGMGWSIYDGRKGPGVTQKTWGQGPGGATALYWDGTSVRRLSPWESMRTHSFPPGLITWLQQRRDVTWEDAYRLCGNSIPVGMLTDVVSHIVSILKPQVLDRAAEAMDRCTRRENRSHRADYASSRYPPR